MKLFVISIIFYCCNNIYANVNNNSLTDSIPNSFSHINTENDNAMTKKKEPFNVDRAHKYRNQWNNLIPTQFIIQNAGNMGVISAGIGWNYGHHDQWETNLLIGYIPKYHSDRSKITMTLKQNNIPWNINYKNEWEIMPLSCGIYLNTVFGNEFWGRQPERYPYKYYEFLSTKLRANIFIGQRISKIISHKKKKAIKDITAFYELSTCDLYIRAMIIDDHIKLKDIVGLSLGVKIQIL